MGLRAGFLRNLHEPFEHILAIRRSGYSADHIVPFGSRCSGGVGSRSEGSGGKDRQKNSRNFHFTNLKKLGGRAVARCACREARLDHRVGSRKRQGSSRSRPNSGVVLGWSLQVRWWVRAGRKLGCSFQHSATFDGRIGFKWRWQRDAHATHGGTGLSAALAIMAHRFAVRIAAIVLTVRLCLRSAHTHDHRCAFVRVVARRRRSSGGGRAKQQPDKRKDGEEDPHDRCYTVPVGRRHMTFRYGHWSRDARARLRTLLNGAPYCYIWLSQL